MKANRYKKMSGAISFRFGEGTLQSIQGVPTLGGYRIAKQILTRAVKLTKHSQN